MKRHLLSLSICLALSGAACSVKVHSSSSFHAERGAGRTSGSEAPAPREPEKSDGRSGSREVVRVTVRPGQHKPSSHAGAVVSGGGQSGSEAPRADAGDDGGPTRVVTPAGPGPSSGNPARPGANGGAAGAGSSGGGSGTSGSAGSSGPQGAGSATGGAGAETDDRPAGDPKPVRVPRPSTGDVASEVAGQVPHKPVINRNKPRRPSAVPPSGETSGSEQPTADKTRPEGKAPNPRATAIKSPSKTDVAAEAAAARRTAAATEGECALYTTKVSPGDLLRVRVRNSGADSQLWLGAEKLSTLRRVGSTWVVRVPAEARSANVSLGPTKGAVHCGKLVVTR